jgi:hypothetical protein
MCGAAGNTERLMFFFLIPIYLEVCHFFLIFIANTFIEFVSFMYKQVPLSLYTPNLSNDLDIMELFYHYLGLKPPPELLFKLYD